MPSDQACPLSALDRRLDDVHRQWHQAEAQYFDPEGFRAAIQTAIQTLRTVTFILQSNKRLIPDFVGWYQEWQDRLRADPLMRWMVDARNKIEKVGDLELHSFVRAEIVASHLDEGPRLEVAANLFEGTEQLLTSLAEQGALEHAVAHGTLIIQRRWVENTLPDWELLEAVTVAYGKLSDLVRSAHEQMGLARPISTNSSTGHHYPDVSGGRLPCMIGHADARALQISLSDRKRVIIDRIDVPFDRIIEEKAAAKFPIAIDEIFAESGATLSEQLHSIFGAARKLLISSGYHDTIALLFVDGAIVHFLNLRPEEHGQKYLMMRQLAHDVARNSADAVIMLAEAWSARFDPEKPYQMARNAPERTEILTGTLVRRDGDAIELMATLERENGAIRLSDTEEITDPALFMFAPIYEVWGRPVPTEWQAAFTAVDVARAGRE